MCVCVCAVVGLYRLAKSGTEWVLLPAYHSHYQHEFIDQVEIADIFHLDHDLVRVSKQVSLFLELTKTGNGARSCVQDVVDMQIIGKSNESHQGPSIFPFVLLCPCFAVTLIAPNPYSTSLCTLHHFPFHLAPVLYSQNLSPCTLSFNSYLP